MFRRYDMLFPCERFDIIIEVKEVLVREEADVVKGSLPVEIADRVRQGLSLGHKFPYLRTPALRSDPSGYLLTCFLDRGLGRRIKGKTHDADKIRAFPESQKTAAV